MLTTELLFSCHPEQRARWFSLDFELVSFDFLGERSRINLRCSAAILREPEWVRRQDSTQQAVLWQSKYAFHTFITIRRHRNFAYGFTIFVLWKQSSAYDRGLSSSGCSHKKIRRAPEQSQYEAAGNMILSQYLGSRPGRSQDSLAPRSTIHWKPRIFFHGSLTP